MSSSRDDSPGTRQPRRLSWWLLTISAAWLSWRVYVYCGPRIPLEVGPDTTFIDAAPLPDGRLDFAAWLNDRVARGVTAENNAATVLLTIVPSESYLREYRSNAIKMLALDIDDVQEVEFLTCAEFLQRRGIKGQQWTAFHDRERNALDHEWSKEEFPELAQWLSINSQALDRVVDAVQRDRLHLPLITRGNLPDQTSFRDGMLLVWELAQALCQRAMLKLDGGKTIAAWSDLLTCRRLGRLATQSPAGCSIGAGIEAQALGGMRTALQNGGLPGDEYRRWLSEVRQLPPQGDLVEKLDTFDRVLAIEAILWVSNLERDRVSARIGLPVLGGGRTMDVNSALREVNSEFDVLVSAIRIDDPALRRTAVAREFVPYDGLNCVDGQDTVAEVARMALLADRQAIAHHVVSNLMREPHSDVHFLRILNDRLRAESVVLTTAMAIMAFHADRGTWPAALPELVPEYLSEVPRDPCSHGELQFRLTPDGWLLGSVGPDGIETGDPAELRPGGEAPDDVLFRYSD